MKTDKEIKKLAESHVDWYQKSVRQLLIDNFIHGYKHAIQEKGEL